MEDQPIETCNCENIPGRLHRNGREEDHNFERHERIFRRFSKFDPDGSNNILSDGRISISAFDVNAMSCNRYNYSEGPEDVLYDAWCKKDVSSYGIVESNVGIIEDAGFQHPSENWTFCPKLKHNSEVCVFPHVEVIIMNGDIEVKKVKPQPMQLSIRAHYQKSFASIIKEPV